MSIIKINYPWRNLALAADHICPSSKYCFNGDMFEAPWSVSFGRPDQFKEIRTGEIK